MSEIAATPTTFPPIDRGHKHAATEQPKKRRSKSQKLPQIEHYKTFKPPERDYRDTELEKFSTFINSYTVQQEIDKLSVRFKVVKLIVFNHLQRKRISEM